MIPSDPQNTHLRHLHHRRPAPHQRGPGGEHHARRPPVHRPKSQGLAIRGQARKAPLRHGRQRANHGNRCLPGVLQGRTASRRPRAEQVLGRVSDQLRSQPEPGNAERPARGRSAPYRPSKAQPADWRPLAREVPHAIERGFMLRVAGVGVSPSSHPHQTRHMIHVVTEVSR